MEELQEFVTPERAQEILHDITKWHEEYIQNNEIESEELQEKILKIKIDNILFNLKNNTSLSGNLSTQKPHVMNPQQWKEIIQLQEYQDSRVDEQVVETDMFQCGRCNSKRCTYFSMQTRSADEGETQFITCMDCNKRWKQ